MSKYPHCVAAFYPRLATAGPVGRQPIHSGPASLENQGAGSIHSADTDLSLSIRQTVSFISEGIFSPQYDALSTHAGN